MDVVNFATLGTKILNKTEAKHLLSYGQATGWLFEHLRPDHAMKFQAYHGPEDTPPVPAEAVFCVDELGYTEDPIKVLDDLEKLCESVVFLTIQTTAEKTLEWWMPEVWRRFEIQTIQHCGEGLYYVIGCAVRRIETVDGEKLGGNHQLHHAANGSR